MISSCFILLLQVASMRQNRYAKHPNEIRKTAEGLTVISVDIGLALLFRVGTDQFSPPSFFYITILATGYPGLRFRPLVLCPLLSKSLPSKPFSQISYTGRYISFGRMFENPCLDRLSAPPPPIINMSIALIFQILGSNLLSRRYQLIINKVSVIQNFLTSTGNQDNF